ncbi:NfeD family protein [Clostridium chrysemydis]|uniref:NfeD family protein n=1 Tax=Clostridium chrysemydis TaxID=2665504 RepID=UPI0018831C2B|nr:NfeD family protein [Clostridium chrysemydis]
MTATVWMVIAAIGVVLDIITSAFLFVWFSVGALGAIIANLVGLEFTTQIIVFIVITIISFAIGYPVCKKKFKIGKNTTKTMEETYIGEVIEATSDIEKGETNARIKVSGIYWSGINLGGEIKKGSKFRIIGIKGSKLEIRGLEEEEIIW